MHQTTEAAASIVDEAKRLLGPETWRPEEVAAALLQRASALKERLQQSDMVDLGSAQKKASQEASTDKKAYSERTTTAAGIAALATILGGFALYTDDAPWPWPAESNLVFAALQIVAIVAAGGYFLGVWWLKPYETWREKRAIAELLRFKIFESLSRPSGPSQSTQGGAALFRPLVVEFVRAFLVEHQKSYFQRARKRSRPDYIRLQTAKVLYTLLIIAAALLALASFAARSLPMEPWWPDEDPWRLWLIEHASAIQLAALIGLTLLGLARSIDSILLADRNVRKYRNAIARLEKVDEEWLDRARQAALIPAEAAAARHGGEDPVVGYVRAATRELSRELDGWSEIIEFVPKLVFEDFVQRD